MIGWVMATFCQQSNMLKVQTLLDRISNVCKVSSTFTRTDCIIYPEQVTAYIVLDKKSNAFCAQIPTRFKTATKLLMLTEKASICGQLTKYRGHLRTVIHLKRFTNFDGATRHRKQKLSNVTQQIWQQYMEKVN